MREALIRKSAAELRVTPNLAPGDAPRAAFSWDRLRDELGAPVDDFNMGRLAVDRHAAGPRMHRVALRFLRCDGSEQTLSYSELRQRTNRFANGLRMLGIGAGTSVFVLAGRIAPLYVAVLGSLKNGCVVTPLFSAFGPEPIATRIGIAQGQVLVTTEALYRRKIEKIRDRLPSLQHVIVVGERDGGQCGPGHAGLDAWMSRASDGDPSTRTRCDDTALLHFTSGTTGTPKGAMHVHDAVAGALRRPAATRSTCIDDDVFWCTADPGLGHRHVLRHHRAAAARRDQHRRRGRVRCRALVLDHRAGAGDQRLVHRADRDPHADEGGARGGAQVRLSVVCASSPASASRSTPRRCCGARRRSACRIHDNWWQTETGGIMIANFAGDGHQARLDGQAAARHRSRDRRATRDGMRRARSTPPMSKASSRCAPAGRRCSAATSARTSAIASASSGDWYLTGDLATRDADGYYWFVGRADDVIKSAGHLIGPFEVESALMEHPAVAEAGVIGKPDPMSPARSSRRSWRSRPASSRAKLAARAARPRAQAARPGGGAEGDRLPRQPAEDAQRQDHAAPAEGARTRAAGGRPLDAGKRREVKPT